MSETPTVPTLTASEETKSKIADWSGKLGISMNTLLATHSALMKKLVTMYPNQPAAFYDQRARHLIAAKYASDLRIKAEAFVMSVLFDGGKVDTNRARIELAKTMYSNEETRAQAIAGSNPLCFPDGTPRDDRVWFVEPTEESRGRKNPNFGKALKPFYQRRLIAIGRKMSELTGTLKLLTVTLRDEITDATVPLKKPVSTRLNVRSADALSFGCTSSRRSIFEAAEAPDLAGWNDAKIGSFLDSAPVFDEKTKVGLKVTVFNIDDFMDAKKRDAFATCILEGDLVQLREDPLETGNYLAILGDVEEDIEGPTKTVFLPAELYEHIKELGLGSRLLVVGTPRYGRDLTTGEMTAVTMNALGIIIKVGISKEESLIEVEEKVEWKG